MIGRRTNAHGKPCAVAPGGTGRTVTRRTSLLATAVSLVALVLALAPLARSRPVPLLIQPFPDAPTYADTAYQIANGNGFGTVIDERLAPEQQPATKSIRPSRYPPAYPLVLALFVRIGDNDPSSAQTGARWTAALLVVSLFLASFVLGGPAAATIAALVTFFSPFAEKSSRLVMSDAFGAALVLLAVAAIGLAWRSAAREPFHTARYAIAGFLAAYAVFVRVSAAGILAAAVLAARRRRLVAAVALGALPVLTFLGAYQWTEFGSPLRSGYHHYHPQLDAFSPGFVLAGSPTSERQFIFPDKLDGALMRWTCPCDQYGPMGKASNAVFYPAVLLGVYWVFSPPLFTLLGLWELVRRRSSPVGKFAALVVVTNVGLFLAYYYQGARLVAPAAYVLVAFSAAGGARLLALLQDIVARRWMGRTPAAVDGLT
jgi:4-amino-4-deoxy-L-arabinose transferase-like glycosyltransferase